MKQLTPKQRIMNAINHIQDEFVPIDFGGTACNMVDTAYFAVKKHLGMTHEIKPYRKGSNVCYYDEVVLKHLGVDVRRSYAKQTSNYPKYLEDGTFVNEWGLVQRDTGLYVETVKNPLEEAEIDDLEGYAWPKPQDTLDVSEMKEEAKRLHEENEYAISLRMPCNGIFEIACWLRGMENFMVDTMIDKEFAHALVEKITQLQIEMYSYLLDEVGEYVDIVESGDDYGSQDSLLMSPEAYREFIFPYRKRLYQAIKAQAPQVKIFFHSCGAIEPIIEDLIDAGVDILNPIQTSANGMDIKVLKEKYGDRICFHGGVDTQKAMKGSVEDVDNEVIRLIKVLAKGGGYILSSCNHIQSDVPAENVVRMFETAKNTKIDE